MEQQSIFQTHRKPIIFVLLLILGFGYYSFTQIQVALFPDVTFPKIKIIADNGEQPVEKMMATVTVPLENAVKQVQGLTVIRSTTSRGSCEISAFFNWTDNIDQDLNQVSAKINQAQAFLPPGVTITVEKMNPSILPVIGYTMEYTDSAKTESEEGQIELRKLANYTVRPLLGTVEGVANVQVMGGKAKEFWIILKPEKLALLRITPQKITDAFANANFILSNGLINDYRRMYLTITDASTRSKEDLENLVVQNDGKRIVHLKDIASIEVHQMDEFIRINANGKDAVLVNVIRQPNANLVSLTDSIKEKVVELNKILPHNVVIKPYYVQSNFVDDSIKSVRDSIFIGLILAVLVVIVFLRSWRASLALICCLPVVLGISLIVLNVLGFTLNIMTLGALAASIGLIIDDAIVVVEQIHREEEVNKDGNIRDEISHAIRWLFPAMIGSSLSTIVIFLPFALLSGLAGAFFKVLAATMIITLIASFFVSWLALPVIYMMLTRKKKEETLVPLADESVLQEIPKDNRVQWVFFFMRNAWIAIITIVVMIASVILIIPNLQTGFLPEMDEGAIVLDYLSPPGTSLDETDKMLRQVEKIIEDVPEVESYSRRTGTQMGFFITEPNNGDYLIQLKKKRNRSVYGVMDELRARIEESQPALEIDFGQVLGDILGDLSGSAQPIEVKLFGNDPEQNHEKAKEIGKVMENINGIADVFNGIIIAGPSIIVIPNQEQLAKYNLTPADLQRQVQLQLQGTEVGTLPENIQYTTIRMRYPNSQANSLERIEQMEIFLPDGNIRPIKNFASIRLEPGQAEIDRENLQPFVDITARLDNRDLGSAMQEIQQQIKANVPLASGQHIEYGGDYQQQQKSFSELLRILLMAGLLVFATLLFIFKDLIATTIILVLSALSISGCLLALFITGTPLNVGSYTGIIMIVGIIAENAVFTFHQFRMSRHLMNDRDAIAAAIGLRIRPKLMTAVGAMLALMPLAFGWGVGSQLHQPLAIAVIGGFCVGLPVLLMIYPSVLSVFYRRKKVTEL
ncbi:MAG: efflux RND transporter permease subunit [Chitinophagales bacterium]|nr:efflux RND transporter permease subunit [Chitinophagales bacterium]